MDARTIARSEMALRAALKRTEQITATLREMICNGLDKSRVQEIYTGLDAVRQVVGMAEVLYVKGE